MDKQAKEIKETLPGAEVERVGDGIKITMNESIVTFAFNSSDLTTVAKANLDKLYQVLVNNADTNINIARLESGRIDIRVETLRKVCYYFDVSLSGFFRGIY